MAAALCFAGAASVNLLDKCNKKHQCGCIPPTRFKPILGALGTCRPWHVMVGYSNPHCCFVQLLCCLHNVDSASV